MSPWIPPEQTGEDKKVDALLSVNVYKFEGVVRYKNSRLRNIPARQLHISEFPAPLSKKIKLMRVDLTMRGYIN